MPPVCLDNNMLVVDDIASGRKQLVHTNHAENARLLEVLMMMPAAFAKLRLWKFASLAILNSASVWRLSSG